MTKLADVLWDAANNWLQPDGENSPWHEGYSCAAVQHACGGGLRADRARAFLRELGCNTDSYTLLHAPWAFSARSQSVRYIWLLLAMHVAEDEGIEI